MSCLKALCATFVTVKASFIYRIVTYLYNYICVPFNTFWHNYYYYYFFTFSEQQYISDVLGLIDHGDPQIRGATAILCAAIIQAALTKTRFNIHTWLASVQSATGLCVGLCLTCILQRIESI